MVKMPIVELSDLRIASQMVFVAIDACACGGQKVIPPFCVELLFDLSVAFEALRAADLLAALMTS